VRFRGERGAGPGVAREFFAALGRQLRTHPGLWRADDGRGLFPAPGADPAAFEALGTLAAKALSMDCRVELPLNPAFVDAARGARVARADVVPALAAVLRGELAGAEFAFPGVVERDGERITAENRDEFVRIVEHAAVGGTPRECAAAFRRGFERVMSFALLAPFSAAEVARLLAGDAAPFTAEDLAECVDVAGYDRDDPQVRNLLEVLGEFASDQKRDFLQFVTGAANLPIGGLSGLRPRLTVARMDVEAHRRGVFLPAALACSNMLRIPPYESKEVMRSKLLLAMAYGKDSFHLG
jgi:E3 ubiquitin-protein ligase TRIP12